MRREWTEWEMQYLEKKYLKQPISVTAKRLGRSVESVKQKASRMGLNRYMDILSAKPLARCFGVDISVVIRWIEKYSMPCRITKDSLRRYFEIDLEQFWGWAEEHKELIDWSRYKHNSLPLEPVWVRNLQFANHTPNSRKRWTKTEEQLMKNMLRRNKTYYEIAEQLGRSYHSVSHHGRILFQKTSV